MIHEELVKDATKLIGQPSAICNYVEWLEKSILVMQPDWICDELGGSEWCNENCEKNNDGYLCKECLEHYYEMKGRTE